MTRDAYAGDAYLSWKSQTLAHSDLPQGEGAEDQPVAERWQYQRGGEEALLE